MFQIGGAWIIQETYHRERESKFTATAAFLYRRSHCAQGGSHVSYGR